MPPLPYASYLELEKLLTLQNLRSTPPNDFVGAERGKLAHSHTMRIDTATTRIASAPRL